MRAIKLVLLLVSAKPTKEYEQTRIQIASEQINRVPYLGTHMALIARSIVFYGLNQVEPATFTFTFTFFATSVGAETRVPT